MPTDSEIYLGIIELCLICLIPTILLELLFAFIFRVQKKNFLVVVLAQIVTNPIVVLASNYISFATSASGANSLNSHTFLLSLAVFELAAIVVEGIIYKHFFRDYNFMNPYVLSLLLNFFSFLIGVGAVFVYAFI